MKLKSRCAAPSHRRRQSGFTLIELLIVIAILAILAAILFPVFARTRENARRASCMSNLKQLALGMQQYVQDYDSAYPDNRVYYQADSSVPGGQAAFGWTNEIYPYVKSLQVYQCPGEVHSVNPALKQPNWRYVWSYTDYAYNTNFSYTFTQSANAMASFVLGGLRESQLSAPAVTVLLQDNFNGPTTSFNLEPEYRPGYDFVFDSNGDYTSYPTSTNELAMQRHLGGANYAFADGHVKFMKATSLSRGWAGYYPSSSGFSAPYPSPIANAQRPSSLNGYAATYAPYDY